MVTFKASKREASSKLWRRGVARQPGRTAARPRGIGTRPSMSVPSCLTVVTTTDIMCNRQRESAGLPDTSTAYEGVAPRTTLWLLAIVAAGDTHAIRRAHRLSTAGEAATCLNMCPDLQTTDFSGCSSALGESSIAWEAVGEASPAPTPAPASRAGGTEVPGITWTVNTVPARGAMTPRGIPASLADLK